jgi:hypothetical protein
VFARSVNQDLPHIPAEPLISISAIFCKEEEKKKNYAIKLE